MKGDTQISSLEFTHYSTV